MKWLVVLACCGVVIVKVTCDVRIIGLEVWVELCLCVRWLLWMY